jgi:hypothetical protein
MDPRVLRLGLHGNPNPGEKKMKITIRAYTRLRESQPVFAADRDDAGRALKSIGALLGGNFVTNEDPEGQSCIWRTSEYKAELRLNKSGGLEFDFKDKANAGSFSAEGDDGPALIKDIQYNVTQFKPSKALNPKVKDLRDKFARIK